MARDKKDANAAPVFMTKAAIAKEARRRELERRAAEQRVRLNAAVKIQSEVRRKQVTSRISQITVQVNEEKARRLVARHLARWHAERAAAYEPGYAFGSPRGRRIHNTIDEMNSEPAVSRACTATPALATHTEAP